MATKTTKDLMKKHHRLSKKCMPGKLKNGQREVFMFPAYSVRPTPEIPGPDYGHHGVEMHFVERRGKVVIDIGFYTPFYSDALQQEKLHDANGKYLVEQTVIGEQPMCTGVYTHSMVKKLVKDSCPYPRDDCDLTGGKCYGVLGSSLYGDEIRKRLLAEGSAGVWAEINKAFKEYGL